VVVAVVLVAVVLVVLVVIELQVTFRVTPQQLTQ
jgi:hypothetical protein